MKINALMNTYGNSTHILLKCGSISVNFMAKPLSFALV
jgi:hypothetical protein